jgi:hypothetical protein
MRDPEISIVPDEDADEDGADGTVYDESDDAESPEEPPAQDDEPEIIIDREDVQDPPEVISRTTWVRLGDLRTEYKFWTNPRRFSGLDTGSIADLARDIAAKTKQVLSDEGGEITYAGIDDPLLVVAIQDNGGVIPLVVDGQRREKAARVAYKSDGDVLVPVRHLELEPVIWTQALSNKYLADSLKKVGLRAGRSAFELAQNAEFLRKQRDESTDRDYTLEKIAQIIGRSESWVSKVLKALGNASPKLIHRWETGEITEEQFRDLATQKDPEQQAAAADAVVEARKSGNTATSRTIAKEQKEIARAARAPKTEKAPKVGKAKKAKGPAVRGPQLDILAAPPRKPPSFAVVEDMLDTAKSKPPTHEYVKGMLDGVRWASGLMDAAKLGKPWQAYLSHVGGSVAAKPEAKPEKVKAAKASTGKRKR